jgi:Fe-S-cluster containining protein
MAKRKLPLLTERSLADVKAARIETASEVDAKLPLVSCKSGCSACCSLPLYVTILEGILLYQHLTAKGWWTPSLRKKLERHATQTFDLASETWLLLNIPCPLLEKDKCIAYAARPFTCRTLYAKSSPEFCHPHRLTNARFVNREEAVDKFRAAEGKILARHKIALFGMPVSNAILIGEKVINGEGDLEHFLSLAVESMKETQT